MSLYRTSGTKSGRENSFDPDGWHDCPWCGAMTRVIFVHGHYACTACHRSVWDCCNGLQADSSTHHHDDPAKDDKDQA